MEVFLLPKGIYRSTMNLRESCVVIDCGDKVYTYTGRDILEETIQNEKSRKILSGHIIRKCNPSKMFSHFQPLYDSSNCKIHGKQDIGYHFEKAYSEKNKKCFFLEFSQWFCRRFKKRQTPEKFLYSSEKRQPFAGFSAQYSECKEADFLGNTKPTIKN